jgi:subtilase family serine protease
VILDDYQDPTIRSDLKLFDQIFGLNDPKLNIIAPGGLNASSDFSAIGFAEEISLDVEWAHAIAPGATIDLVLGNPADSSLRGQIDALIKATAYAVSNHLGSVISLSVGLGESCYSRAEIQQWNQAFVRAQQQKISVLVSSGDRGAAAIECDRAGVPLRMIQGVNYPASDPFVTSVGGTTLLASKTGQYGSETVWNGMWVASGGGFSHLFAAPDYQRGIVGIGTYRALPDVAYDADPDTGMPVVMTIGNATLIVPFGGTSAGAPQWAALVTLAEQSIGRPLGFLNPSLYHLGESNAFHDVTVGNNTVTGIDAHSRPIQIHGYQAGSGWDPVTGWGSPNTAHLAQLLRA